MFEVKMVDGQEIRETKGDTFSLNPNTGVLTISRANGFEETSMHYSPAAWSSVKHTIQRSLVPASGWGHSQSFVIGGGRSVRCGGDHPRTYSHLWPDANDRTRRAAGELLEAARGAAVDPLRTESEV